MYSTVTKIYTKQPFLHVICFFPGEGVQVPQSHSQCGRGYPLSTPLPIQCL